MGTGKAGGSAEPGWAEPLVGEPGIGTSSAVLKQDLLCSLSCGGFDYIINYRLSLFAACSSTTATLEVACATRPTRASVAGKTRVSTELLQPLWSAAHGVFVELLLLGT